MIPHLPILLPTLAEWLVKVGTATGKDMEMLAVGGIWLGEVIEVRGLWVGPGLGYSSNSRI